MATEVIEDRLRIDVRWLARHRYLQPSLEARPFAWRVDGELVAAVNVFTTTEDSIDLAGWWGEASTAGAHVRLERTGLTFGERPWFTCPDCDRRCAWLALDGDTFTCRTCLALPNLRPTLGRAARRRDDLHQARALLNFDAAGRAQRPKGMHARTWARRWERYWRAQEAIAASWAEEKPASA